MRSECSRRCFSSSWTTACNSLTPRSRSWRSNLLVRNSVSLVSSIVRKDLWRSSCISERACISWNSCVKPSILNASCATLALSEAAPATLSCSSPAAPACVAQMASDRKPGRAGMLSKGARASSWILEVSSSWSRESSATRLWLTSSEMPSLASTRASSRRNLFCICFAASSAVALARRTWEATCWCPCSTSVNLPRTSSSIWCRHSQSRESIWSIRRICACISSERPL
mmetsp:Transcript_1946/g.5643  ORF Transcript_1946/g.5643 Transcript_1946/m.5643 type:complete len:229 (+) Transcript_1946:691-1377(+)